MTKIFISIPWFLPAFRAGGPIQSVANLVREYNEEVEYYIYCADTDLDGSELENVVTGKWTNYNSYTKVWYAVRTSVSDHLVKQTEIIKPDVLLIVGLYDWHFNMVPLLFCKAPKKIVSVRGMLHPGALSQKRWKKKLYLQLFRLLKFPQRVVFHATDETEKEYIKQYLGKDTTVLVAGNFPNYMGCLPLPS